MKKAILIHGWNTKEEFYDPDKPTASNDHWFPWLTKELMMRDIHTIALEMPKGYLPDYRVWKTELERFDIDEETCLIGHSCGGGFLVRWLSENNSKVGKVFLVAPWTGFEIGKEFAQSFFDFQIDSKIAASTAGLTMVYSTNDFSAVMKSVEQLKESLEDIKLIELKDKGHFTRTSLGTEAFPELLQEVLA